MDPNMLDDLPKFLVIAGVAVAVVALVVGILIGRLW